MGTLIIPALVGVLVLILKGSSRLIGRIWHKERLKIVLTGTVRTLRNALCKMCDVRLLFFLFLQKMIRGKCHDAITELISLFGTLKEIGIHQKLK